MILMYACLWLVSSVLTLLIVGKVNGQVDLKDLLLSLITGPLGLISWIFEVGDIVIWRSKK
jgi:hypothetical protein